MLQLAVVAEISRHLGSSPAGDSKQLADGSHGQPADQGCASWCHWDWTKNCDAAGCRSCHECGEILFAPRSPPAPSPLPVHRVTPIDKCGAVCISQAQCSDDRCSLCGYCQGDFRREDAANISDCEPQTEYDSAHAECLSFCSPQSASTHCALCKCSTCDFCLNKEILNARSMPPQSPPNTCFLGAEVTRANPGSAHVLFNSYEEKTVVVLDFSDAEPSLHVELLEDNGIHNKLFKPLPSSEKLVRFLLLPNAITAGHKERAALKYTGPWKTPRVSCVLLSHPPSALSPPPPVVGLLSRERVVSKASPPPPTTMPEARAFASCMSSNFHVDDDWGFGFRCTISFNKWITGGLIYLPLDQTAGTVDRIVDAELLEVNTSSAVFRLTGLGTSFSFSLKGSVPSVIGKPQCNFVDGINVQSPSAMSQHEEVLLGQGHSLTVEPGACGSTNISWGNMANVNVSDILSVAIFYRDPVLRLAETKTVSRTWVEVSSLDESLSYAFAIRFKWSSGKWSALSSFTPVTSAEKLMGECYTPWTQYSPSKDESNDSFMSESTPTTTEQLAKWSAWDLIAVLAVGIAIVTLIPVLYHICNFLLGSKRRGQHQPLSTTEEDHNPPASNCGIDFYLSDDDDDIPSGKLQEQQPAAFCRLQKLLQLREQEASVQLRQKANFATGAFNGSNVTNGALSGSYTDAEMHSKPTARTNSSIQPLLPPPTVQGPPIPLLPPPPIANGHLEGSGQPELLGEPTSTTKEHQSTVARAQRSHVESGITNASCSRPPCSRPTQNADLMAQIERRQFQLRPVPQSSTRNDQRDHHYSGFMRLGGLAAELAAAMRSRRLHMEDLAGSPTGGDEEENAWH